MSSYTTETRNLPCNIFRLGSVVWKSKYNRHSMCVNGREENEDFILRHGDLVVIYTKREDKNTKECSDCVFHSMHNECKKYAPTWDSKYRHAVWPETGIQDSCGEFKSKNER